MTDSNRDWPILRPISPLSYAPLREMEQHLNELFRAEVQARLASLSASQRSRQRSHINSDLNLPLSRDSVSESNRSIRRSSSTNRSLAETDPEGRQRASLSSRVPDSRSARDSIANESDSSQNSSASGSVSSRDFFARGSISSRNSFARGSVSNRDASVNGSLSSRDSSARGSVSSRDSFARGSDSSRDSSARGSVSSRDSSARGSLSSRDSTARGSVSSRDSSPRRSESARSSTANGTVRSPAASSSVSSRAPASHTNGVLTMLEEPETGTAHGTYTPVVAIRPMTSKAEKKNESNSLDERYQCINFIPQYRDKSLEELRLEDYTTGRKKRSIFVFEAKHSKPVILPRLQSNHSTRFKGLYKKLRRLPSNCSTLQSSQKTPLHAMFSNLNIRNVSGTTSGTNEKDLL